MNNVVAMNVTVGGSKLSGRFQTVGRKVQEQVKYRTEIRERWLDVIVKVKGISTTNSSNLISIVKVAPGPDGQFIKTGETLYFGDQIPRSQYGQKVTYQEHKNSIRVQQSIGGDIFIDSIKLAAALALPLCNVCTSTKITLVDKVVAVVTLISVAILLHQLMKHQLMKGTDRSGDNLHTPNTLRLLLVISSMGIPGAHAQEPSVNIADSAHPIADGNVLEEDNIQVAALLLTVMVVGGASLAWMFKLRSMFDIERGLKQTPVARRSNPVFEIHPELESGAQALLY